MSEVYRLGPFELHADRHELLRDGAPLRIEPKPLEVLAELVRHAGELVTKAELMESVWPERVVTESVIARCINKLRVALDDESQTLILTVHGYGYRFMGKVTCVQDEPASGAKIATVEPPKAGDTPPMRPNWRLLRPLDDRGAVWLAVHEKTAEKRVFKYGIEPHQVRSLRREISIHRLLQKGLGERSDIARLLDFNLQTLPYFLELEYCAHGNLTDWCASHGGVDQVPMGVRIDLMAQAAEALSAAHLLGVLHMDIKPSNLLVWSAEGGRPRLRWSDFGSGRLLQPWRLSELGITQLGSTRTAGDVIALQGTLNYLAPELLRGETPTIRSDLYALGVMLYQIVAGDLRKPMAVGWEENVADELLRSDIAACAHDNPALRLSSADELASRLRELDKRRIARHREHEIALQAAEMRKRLDRARVRRPWLIAAIGALVLGLGISLWFYGSAIRARDEALHRQKVAEATRTFVDEIINAAAPFTVGNHGERSIREAIDYASTQIDRDFKGQPELEAAVRITLATVKSQMGDIKAAGENAERAAELSRRALGPDDPQTLNAEFMVAIARLMQSRFAEADAVMRSMESRIATARITDPDTRIRMASLRATYYDYLQQYERSVTYSEAAVAEQLRFDPAHLSMLTRYRSRLAIRYAHLGRFDLAQQQFDQIKLDLGRAETSSATLSARVEELYGIHLYLQQRYAEAEEVLTEAAAALVRNLGPEDELAAESMRYHGLNLLELQHAAEAFEACRMAYDGLRRSRGGDSHLTLMALGDLGITELETQRTEQGMAHLTEAADKLESTLGWSAPDVQYFRYQFLGEVIRSGRQLDAGEKLLDKLDPAVLRYASPRENWDSRLKLLRGRLLLAEGRKAAAAKVLGAALEDLRRLPTQSPEVAEVQKLLLAARE